ncbi:MAG: RsmD family RNA methyltransferase, partial [Candidatus Limnocylindrus sp.]
MAQRIRIIAGEFGGRLLEVPEQGTRPLADRVRQALFAILEPRLPDTRVLDLCAGSGAAGLEALSR